MPPVGDTIDNAGAAVIDSAVAAAAEAERAAENAGQHATHIAAVAVEAAQERTAQLETNVAQAVNNQEEQLSWLRNHAEETASRLTATMERQTGMETILARTQEQIAELLNKLTPPVSEEPPQPVTEPEKAAEGADGQKEAETKPRRQKNHHWM